ncbi:MAG: signal peptidase II [Planctomycetota bacterium]|jgi:signal peptidase II
MTETRTEEDSTRVTLSRASLKQVPLVLPGSKAHLVFWPLMVGGLVLDLWTKKAVFGWLELYEVFPVVDGFLQFVPKLNNGAAFGWFAGKAYFLTAVSAIAMVVVLGVFLLGGSRRRLVHIALGLFAAGICGNLYDRIFNDGSVRDFIDVYYRSYHWHTFNVADSLLCIGVGLLIISTSLIEKPARKRDRQHK